MNGTSSDKGGQQFLDYLIIIAKHSRMIIFVSAAVTVLIYLVLLIRPNQYTTTARMLPPQQNLTLSRQLLDILGGTVSPGAGSESMRGGMGGLASSLLGLRTPGEIYVSMMHSNTVRDKIIARFNLKKLYDAKFIEDARRVLSEKAKIMAGRKDGIIVIEMTADTPKLAAEIANAFFEELDDLLHKLTMQEVKGRLAFLEKERLQSSQKLTKAEEEVRSFSEKNSVLQIDTQTKGALEYIARLRAEIDSKEVSIQVLRQQATPFNFDMVRMETEIKGLKEKLRSVECQYDNNLGGVCLPTNKAPGLTLEYIRLYRETKFQEGLYQLYVRLVEIAKLDMARDITVIQILDTGKPPEKRSNRRAYPAIMMGMFTFVMMIFLAFGLEYMHKVNNREHDVQRYAMLKDHLKFWRDMLARVKNAFNFKK